MSVNKKIHAGLVLEGQAHAKLNLRLKLVGRKENGYHLLSMLNVITSLRDEIKIELISGRETQINTTFNATIVNKLSLEDKQKFNDVKSNLITKAIVKLLSSQGCDIAARVSVVKNIPLSGGFGGGSSDAALALNLIASQMWPDKSERISRLLPLAATLGADVPYFLYSQFARVSGIGEVVQPLTNNPLLGDEVLIVIPVENSVTAHVYESVRRKIHDFKPDSMLTSQDTLTRAQALSLVQNDFEEVVIESLPSVGNLLRQLRQIDGVIAGMTGSGSGLFVIAAQGSGKIPHDIYNVVHGIASSVNASVVTAHILDS